MATKHNDPASKLLESISSFRRVSGLKPEDNLGGDDNGTEDPETTEDPNAQEPPATTDDDNTTATGGLEGLEAKFSELLADKGVSSVTASEDDDGAVFIDLSFEDGTNASVEISVTNEGDEQGVAKAFLVTDDSGEAADEVELPETVIEDGKISIEALNSADLSEISTMVSQVVSTSDESVGFRRNDGMGESVKVSKKRITTTMFKGENKWLRDMIKKRKVEGKRK